jgi:hypothetical protein
MWGFQCLGAALGAPKLSTSVLHSQAVWNTPLLPGQRGRQRSRHSSSSKHQGAQSHGSLCLAHHRPHPIKASTGQRPQHLCARSSGCKGQRPTLGCCCGAVASVLAVTGRWRGAQALAWWHQRQHTAWPDASRRPSGTRHGLTGLARCRNASSYGMHQAAIQACSHGTSAYRCQEGGRKDGAPRGGGGA